MACQVVVVAGPANSGKRARLLCAYRQALSELPFGSTLWIAPTHRATSEVARQVFDASLPGCLAPNLLTFEQLATRVLDSQAPRLRPLSRDMVRTLLGQLIAQRHAAGKLVYFGPIAGTPGFHDLLVSLVRELKRLEIWPEELAAAQGKRATPRDRELRELYQDYQDLLNRQALYDAEGRFWAARQLLRAGNWGPLGTVRRVFVEGFADFTRTEHEVLELLAQRSERMEITLTLDADEHRPELFFKTRDTLERLRRKHPTLTVEHLARRNNGHALAHLERNLFGNPRQAREVDNPAGIEIIAAAGVTHEVELLAGRIKSLLLDGDDEGPVAAADILVVFRSLSDVAPLVREVFARFGIPTVVASAPKLGTSPLIRALLGWLRLDLDDWPFRQVIAALGNNYFRPTWPEMQDGRALAALNSLVRALQLPDGRSALVKATQWLVQRASAAESVTSRKLIAATSAGPLLMRVVEALEQLPQQATLARWWTSLTRLAKEFGLIGDATDAARSLIWEQQDRLAWQRLEQGFLEAERLSRWTDTASRKLNREEIVAFLEDLARNAELPAEADETGAVRVLAAESMRALAAPYVFLAGLTERSFPQAHRDDCLYSDADARRWGAAGLPLPSNEMRSRFELLLFYEIVTSATRKLVLSYPALDAAAQPLVPSPYLSEIELACGRGKIARNTQPHLDTIPPDDQVRCQRDFRVKAVANALAGDDALLADLCAHPATHATASNILAGLQMSESRHGQTTFGPFEGIFSSNEARAGLAEQFGPARCWSASQLERYAYCPHQFFLHNVLRLRPLEEPELNIDYLTRGEMLHWLLATAHRELNASGGGPASPAGRALAQFNAAVSRLAAELRTKYAGDALESGLVEINVRKITEWLARYSRQHAEYDRQWQAWDAPPRPAHFEVAFGPPHFDRDADEAAALPDGGDALSSLEPFELDCGVETVKFSGRIDRIDLGMLGGQQVFTIVDYKSGAVSKRTNLKAVESGLSLQLPLYALAAQRLLSEKNATPFRAAYWHLSGKGYQEKEALQFRIEADGRLELSDAWLELEAQLRQRVHSLVKGIRQGEFPMFSADDECTGFCDFSTVCRVNQARSRGKLWQPPGAVQS